ncbi:MAG: riboflavin synthase [Ignavibacteriaceae bacterium]|nr:riboflavin synthase [Ignavibacteriaceae bacterium]HRN26968.1 riboflavin synthase [Ignavibacteriaceae bacterium]HRP93399.1 riboflavin synthase [Ignavibacteriaceae bacterium]HRQ54544.1 riboflavin synthase [Ignavibacteriaceae bacterium]
MFTGLVEEKGKLKDKIATGDGFQFVIEAKIIMDDLKIGSSIAVNGCCLTVVKIDGNTFAVDTIEETLNKTNLGVLKEGMNVNLERPLAADARLGGHFVLGHIDTTGKVEDVKELSNSHWLTISFPEKFKQYLIYVGSVAIDGVSMTVAELKNNSFSVGIIPHTWKETIFADKKIGDTVNLEFDVLGKYVERIMESKNEGESSIFLN